MLMSISSMMGQKATFNAACLNVDGLPPSISVAGIKITLNPDGAREAGSTRISELIAQKGWDFFSVSEDFNYHDELISQITDYYDIGWYRGEVSTSNTTTANGKIKIKTDGLDLMWKKKYSTSGETLVRWNKTNGYTDSGADELLLKGYRYYCVTVANGLAVDVYIHHMDAETSADDIAARESQITQLVEAIKATDNHRPIIVMGDTNCRYTRDRLKELMFDAINADPRFDMHDPWVDQEWDGVFPTYGGDALMTHTYGDQKGEVVDKLFYINNTDANGIRLTANSYLHDTDFSYADGTSISDHYPVVVNFTIENTSDNLSEGSYYIRNAKTKQFLTAGSYWGTHAIVGETGNYVTLEKASNDGEYYMHTTCGYLSHGCYMDSSQDVFTIKKTDSGNHIISYVDGDTYALTALDDKLVNSNVYEEGNSAQEWEFLSQEELVQELYTATEEAPLDATFFIKGANFSRNDSANDSWTKSKDSGLSMNHGGIDGPTTDHNFIYEFRNNDIGKLSTTKTSGSMTQSATGLPNGKYRLSAQVFKREDGDNFTIKAYNGSSSELASLYIPSISEGALDTQIHETAIQQSNGKWVPDSIKSAAAYFNAGLYNTSAEFTVTDHNLTVTINKAHTKATKWYAFDNFRLTYLGPTEEDNAAYDAVKAAMDDAAAKASDYGLTNFNNSTVEERYNDHLLTGDGTSEVKMTYVALANAAIAQTGIPTDMRFAILNNSFEMGSTLYWDNSGIAAVANAESLDADGTYTYSGNTITQSTENNGITLPNGLYELTAELSAGASLTANGQLSEASTATEGTLQTVSVRFPVSAGTAVIGATANGTFTADNFVLTRIGSTENLNGFSMLQAAINDATSRVNALGSPYNDGWDMSKYQTLVDNYTLEGDGTTEFNEIYSALRERVCNYALNAGDNADMTSAIINPSFEFGELWGWSYTNSADTGVKENSNSTYKTTGCDGSYLFNTWWTGTPITQTLNNLPDGKYRLSALVASDANANIYLVANDNRTLTTISSDGTNGTFVEATIDIYLKDGESLTIGAVGGNNDGSYNADGYWWYKADNFRLTRLGDWENRAAVQNAINDVTTRVQTLPEGYNTLDLSKYQEMVDNYAIEGDGSTEVAEIYALLRDRAISQINDKSKDVDLTATIINPSFELGTTFGWNVISSSDTGVKENSNSVYTTSGCDGAYLFNTYWQGTPITQTIKNLPAGKYKITTLLASDTGAHIYLFANDAKTLTNITGDKTSFTEVSVECELQKGDNLTIGVVGGTNDGSYTADGYWWYKTDNFRITYTGAPSTTTGIETVVMTADTTVDVYNISGIKVRSGVAYGNALNGLAPGIYMLQSGNYVEKIAHN